MKLVIWWKVGDMIWSWLYDGRLVIWLEVGHVMGFWKPNEKVECGIGKLKFWDLTSGWPLDSTSRLTTVWFCYHVTAKIKLLYLRVKYSDIRIRMLDVIPFKCQKLTQSQSYCHNLCHIWTHFESKILFWTWNESGIKTQMTRPDIEVSFSES